MNRKLEILHLEDNEFDAEMTLRLFKTERLEASVNCVQNRREFEKALELGGFDLIISDYSIPGFDGLSALKLAREKRPEIPFIFASGTIGEERAVEALKLGATDYVIKDRLARLVPAIRRALEEAAFAKEHRQAREQLEEQATLLDRARDAICLNDLEQNILYWNGSAARLYGWSVGEALGRNAGELLFREDLATPLAALKKVLRDGEWQGELHQVTKEGKEIIVESRWTLVRDRSGGPKSILVINTDITEKKQIEAQLQRTQRMDSIGALAGGIAHDLNNCLTPVMLGMNFVQTEVTSEPGVKMLGIMQASAQRSVDMVKQILAFARGAGGEHAVLQPRHLIKEMIRLAEDTFPRSLEIQGDIAPELSAVLGNATQLKQVLLNLCVNARDAMPGGGRLCIEAADVILDEASARPKGLAAGLYVRLIVSDTGQGMSQEILAKIFEPFFTTKEHGKGTGLGLSTVMGIVKTHGGFIGAASEPGRGSVFTVYLPTTSRAAGGSPVERPAAGNLAGHGEMILLVDDEGAVLEVTRLLLESSGYNVLTARNGGEAVAVFRRHQKEIAAVIADMMMPVMNGEETIEVLQQIDPAVKVIGVSGLGSSSSLMAAGESKAQAFLKKPFTTTDLLATVHRLLHETALAPAC